MKEFLSMPIWQFLVQYRLPLTAIAAVWNTGVFALYAVDKSRAKRHAWRIPEKTLIWAVVCFGSYGAMAGIFLLRHKTKHPKFTVTVPVFLILHTLLWGALWLFPDGI